MLGSVRFRTSNVFFFKRAFVMFDWKNTGARTKLPMKSKSVIVFAGVAWMATPGFEAAPEKRLPLIARCVYGPPSRFKERRSDITSLARSFVESPGAESEIAVFEPVTMLF